MTTQTKQVNVSPGGKAGPYIRTPVQYVEPIREFLVKLGVRFNVDHQTYKSRDIPEFKVFNITRDCTEEQFAKINDFFNDAMYMWEFDKE